jgi:GNAT superfamily N-acetyltransferase
MTGLELALGGAALAELHHEAICRLYGEVFSEPPFVWEHAESHRHAAFLAGLRHESGFGIAVATNGLLVGFAYGFTLPVDHRWWSGLERPQPEAVTTEWEGRTFGFVNLAVVRSQWDRGVGRRLIETLLDSRPESRMLGTVQPTAERTQAIYRHLGWRYLGRKGPVEDAVCRYWDLYTEDLAP